VPANVGYQESALVDVYSGISSWSADGVARLRRVLGWIDSAGPPNLVP
jgi:hypothetical protein